MNDREETLKRTLVNFFREKQEEMENHIAELSAPDVNASNALIQDYRRRTLREINEEALRMCAQAGYTTRDANRLIGEAIEMVENNIEPEPVLEEPEEIQMAEETTAEPVEIEEVETQPEENIEAIDEEKVDMSPEEKLQAFANSDEFQDYIKRLNEMRDGIKRMEADLAPYKKYGPMDGDGYLYAKEEQERIDLRKDELESLEKEVEKKIDGYLNENREEIQKVQDTLDTLALFYAKRIKELRENIRRMEENLAPYKKYGPMDGDGYLYAKEEQERIDLRKDELRNLENQSKEMIDEFVKKYGEEALNAEVDLEAFKKYGMMDRDGLLYAKEEQERIEKLQTLVNNDMDYLLGLANIEVVRPIRMKVTINDLENDKKTINVSINDKKVCNVDILGSDFSSKKVEEICNSAVLAYTLNQNKNNKAIINYNGKTVESSLGEMDKGIDKVIKAVSEEKIETVEKSSETSKSTVSSLANASVPTDGAMLSKEEIDALMGNLGENQATPTANPSLEEQKRLEKKKKEEETKTVEEDSITPETEENEIESDLTDEIDDIDTYEFDTEEPEIETMETPEIMEESVYNSLDPYDEVNSVAMKVTNSRNLNMSKKSAITAVTAIAALGLGAAALAGAISLPVSFPIAMGTGAVTYQYFGVIKDGIEFTRMQSKCKKIAKKYKKYNVDFVYDTKKRRADFVQYATASDMKKGKNGIYITEDNYRDIFKNDAEAFIRDFDKAFAKENKRRKGDGARGNYPQITPFDLRTAFVGIGGVKTPKEIAIGSMAVESYRADIEKAADEALKAEEVIPVSPEEIEEAEELEEPALGEEIVEPGEASLNADEATPEEMVEAIDETLESKKEDEAPTLEPVDETVEEPTIEDVPIVPEIEEAPAEVVLEPENVPVSEKETPEELSESLDNILNEKDTVENVPAMFDSAPSVVPYVDEATKNGMLTPAEISDLLEGIGEPSNTPMPTSSLEENKAMETAEKTDNQELKTNQTTEPVELSENVKNMIANFEENYKDVTDVRTLDNAVQEYVEQAKMLGTISTDEEVQQFVNYCNDSTNQIVIQRTNELWNKFATTVGHETSKDRYLSIFDDFINQSNNSTDIEALNMILNDQQNQGYLTVEEYDALKESIANKQVLLDNQVGEKVM